MTTGSHSKKLILALPSKGRIMEDAAAVFARAGITISKSRSARGYQGEIVGMPDVDIHYVSASDIAGRLRAGTVHLGVTGQDLVAESAAHDDGRVILRAALGFGHADVVVAVPASWLDVNRLVDLETMGLTFRRQHGHRVRVATKFLNITRREFARAGIASYRIVESLGATEGAPAGGLAELIVDITSTGATLKANGLKILDDGVLLRSQVGLFASDVAPRSTALDHLASDIVARVSSVMAADRSGTA